MILFKTPKRHLLGYGLTPDTYRERYSIAANCPMIAPAYRKRAAMSPSGLALAASPSSRMPRHLLLLRPRISASLAASPAWLAVGLLGEVLASIGYVAIRLQTPQTMENLRLMMVIGPLTFGVAGAAFMWFYPLDRLRHGRLVRALAWRKARGAKRQES